MKFGCSIGVFLNSANLICRSTDISNVSEGPIDFEIMRVDCIFQKGNNFSDFLFAFLEDRALSNGGFLFKEKNVLLKS